MSLYNDASLVMIPSAYKDGKLYSIKPTDGSGDFTFSRGSNLAATRVDENGLIEKGRENRLLQSNQFDTTWLKTNVSVTSGQTGYDGSNDAWLLEKSAVGAFLYQLTSVSSINTFSVYAKAGTLSHLAFRIRNAEEGKFFNLSNGTIGSDYLSSPIDAKIEDVGNGWYRCSITTDDATNNCRIYPVQADGDFSGTSGSIYIQDAQLEQGLVATDYIETTTTTAQAGILEDMPRLDYSGGASCPSLLLEPTRTNLIQYSEDFTTRGGYWQTFGNATKTLFAAISPDGYNTAAHITGLNGDGTNDFRYALSYNTANKSVVYSVYLKGSGTLRLQISNGIDQAHSEDITLTSDWQRHSVSGTFNSTSVAVTYLNIDDLDGKTATEYYVWGAQFEEGSYPTSYIPCYGAATTRSGDDTSSTNLQSNNILGLSSGTIFLDIRSAKSEDNNEIVWQWKDSSDNIILRFYYREEGQCSVFRFYNNLDAEFLTDNISLSESPKIAISYDGTSRLELFGDGVKLTKIGGNFQSNAAIAIFEQLNLVDNATEFNNISFFPTALTDSECIALTTI